MPLPARDLMKQIPVTQVMLYGPPGVGKTNLGARSPTPLILLTEAQGMGSVYAARPDALVEPIKTYPHFKIVIDSLLRGAVTELDGEHAYKFRLPLHKDAERYSKIMGVETKPTVYTIQTVVLDSITDLHRQLMKHHPDPKDPDGSDWRKVQRDMALVLDDLRSLPVNILAIALADDFTDKQKVRHVRPALYGKLANQAGQYFAGVGYCHKIDDYDQDGNASIKHVVSWSLSSSFQTKLPPCDDPRGFPVQTVNTMEPGKTTLGSILKAMYPNHNTASCDGDSADHVWS